MEASDPKRVLIVANRTAATPTLLEEVRRRAGEGSCTFTLLVPDVALPERHLHGSCEHDEHLQMRLRELGHAEHEWALELALPLLERAAQGHVEGLLRGPEPFEAVKATLEEGDYDEVIISTLPKRVSRWLQSGWPHDIEQLGVPVTLVTAPGRLPLRLTT